MIITLFGLIALSCLLVALWLDAYACCEMDGAQEQKSGSFLSEKERMESCSKSSQ